MQSYGESAHLGRAGHWAIPAAQRSRGDTSDPHHSHEVEPQLSIHWTGTHSVTVTAIQEPPWEEG